VNMKRCAPILGTLIVFANTAVAQPVEADKIFDCYLRQTSAYLGIQRPALLVAMISVSTPGPLSEEEREASEKLYQETDRKSAPYKSNMDRFKLLTELPENQISKDRMAEISDRQLAELNVAKERYGEAGVPVSWFTSRADKCAQILLTE
jgi:hypothetical protein